MDFQIAQLTLKSAHLRALEKDVAGLPDVKAVFGSQSMQVSTKELAERIVALAGSPAGITYVPHPGQDVMERWPRTERLRGATDWEPRVGLDEGLSRTIAFWRRHASG